ncbi:MAG TPA: DUF433 domain-containing protein, partial [Tepidisphaeraceae bacterium]
MTATSYHHIELDADGVAWINGTNTKVLEIVVERLAYDWDADQLRAQHPHLSLAQVHSALAYYYDHQQEIDRDIEQRLARADAIVSGIGESAV